MLAPLRTIYEGDLLEHKEDLKAEENVLRRGFAMNEYKSRHAADDDLQLNENIQTCVIWTVGIMHIVILSLCVYALFVTDNSSKFHTTCGDDIWKFAVARLTVGAFIEVVLAMFIWGSSSGAPYVVAYDVFVLLYGVLHLLSIVFGSVVTNLAFRDSACVDAMSAASSTGTPLLAIMCIILLIFDGIAVLYAFGHMIVLFSGDSSRQAQLQRVDKNDIEMQKLLNPDQSFLEPQQQRQQYR
jgi:hypothetical protein